MPLTHTTRTGKTYYLHTGPKRGGGTQYFVSTKPGGTLAERMPDGFELHETVNGLLHFRRIPPQLIHPEEVACVREHLPPPRSDYLCALEVEGKAVVVYDWQGLGDSLARMLNPRISPAEELRGLARFVHYQAVMRFVLVDAEARRFAPERFCFRGSVDDWISIGPHAAIQTCAARYLKHLGRESLFEQC